MNCITRRKKSVNNLAGLSEEYLQICRDALAHEKAESLSGTNNWEHVDRKQVHEDWDTLYKEISEDIENRKPGDAISQSFIDRHFQIACRFYVPTREAYIGMALFYDSNADMNAFHNDYHPKMVEFLMASMIIYAKSRLSS